MGGDADRRAVYHGVKFYYDNECVRAVFPSVPLHGDCAHPLIDFCRGAVAERGEKFYQILCGGVSGRGDYRACLHHILPVCGVPARSRSQCGGSHNGMELYRGADFQHACAGRSREDGRPGSA